MTNTLIFLCWKNVSSFCIAKATHIFAAKICVFENTLHFCSKNINIHVFENTLAPTFNKFVINDLIKLTMIWTTGPRAL